MKKTLSVILISVMMLSVIFVAVIADDTTETVTFKFSEMGYSNADLITKIEKDGITIELGLGDNTNGNAPAYYDSGTNLRIYKLNSFKITSEKTIVGITFNFTNKYATTYTFETGEYKLDGLVGTWTGSATVLNIGTPDKSRLTDITFTLQSSGSPQTPDDPEEPDPFVRPETPEAIVDALYALEKNETLPEGPYTLTGKVTEINYAWSEEKQNMTVTIVVGDKTDKPIQCYYLTNGETCKDCNKIAVGDKITVKGELKHYYNSKKDTSTFEFDRGCTLEGYKKALVTPEEIVDALYALEKGATLEDGPYTLTGKVTQINYAWNAEKKNMTVTIVVGEKTDKPIQCYYLTNSEECQDCDKIAEGDSITVRGQLKHYYNSKKDTSTYEFDSGCVLVALTKAEPDEPDEPEVPVLDTPEKIVKAAYALETGKALDGTYELTGTIISVDTPYNSQFGNVTVTIVVEGLENYPIQCFRMKNGAGVDGVDKIAEKDIITVSGKLKRYTDSIVEFDSGCELLAFTIVEKEGEDEQLPETVEEIINALYALESGKYLKGEYTLTGKVTEITTPFSEEYQNVTVVMVVEGFEEKPVTCYRLAGEGSDKIEVGDTITVEGPMKNHNGTYEFAQGAQLKELVKAEVEPSPTSDASVIAIAAVAIIALGGVVIASKKK